jgi:hypothetical protein
MPLLLLTGHQRSGTTILRILLNSHPEIAVTNELASLKHIHRSRFFYSVYILHRLLDIRGRGPVSALHRNELTSRRENTAFVLQYLVRVQAARSLQIGFTGAESALQALFPKRRWVGDKFPEYIWNLRYFAGSAKLRCIVIYRDARDVVCSTLESARTVWKDRAFVRAFDTPEKVAARWVESIELMEACAGKILPVSYERLITEPETVAGEVGLALDVDPACFPIHILRDSSIGKHRNRLAGKDLAVIESIAGPAQARRGYR